MLRICIAKQLLITLGLQWGAMFSLKASFDVCVSRLSVKVTKPGISKYFLVQSIKAIFWQTSTDFEGQGKLSLYQTGKYPSHRLIESNNPNVNSCRSKYFIYYPPAFQPNRNHLKNRHTVRTANISLNMFVVFVPSTE